MSQGMAEVSRDTAQGFEVAPFDTLLRYARRLSFDKLRTRLRMLSLVT